MRTPIKRDPRFDALDAEQFERMLASKSWGIYQERMRSEVRRQVERCCSELDEIELRRAQGAAAILQSVLSLPVTLLEELRRRPNSPV